MKIQRFAHASLFLTRSVHNREVANEIKYQMEAYELGLHCALDVLLTASPKEIMFNCHKCSLCTTINSNKYQTIFKSSKIEIVKLSFFWL